jgi:hypothetical protein
MVGVVANPSIDEKARFLACTIFKNAILNTTKVM